MRLLHYPSTPSENEGIAKIGKAKIGKARIG
nr:MAG TPA: hypothetical protein [Caudoviricetes sp.]